MKLPAPLMTNMIGMAVRRISGIIFVLLGIAYYYAHTQSYDIPQFDLPEWVHSPVFYGAYLFVTVWCWLPVLITIPSRRSVNLTPTPAQQFETPSTVGQTGWGEPFEMPPGSGQWYMQGYGQYWVWSTEQNEWIVYEQ